MVWIVASLAMFLMVVAGPKRPLGCGSTTIFGTAGHQLQQDLLRSPVGANLLQTLKCVLGCLAGANAVSVLQRSPTSLQCKGLRAPLARRCRRGRAGSFFRKSVASGTSPRHFVAIVSNVATRSSGHALFEAVQVHDVPLAAPANHAGQLEATFLAVCEAKAQL
jgi:hypothetical protein